MYEYFEYGFCFQVNVVKQVRIKSFIENLNDFREYYRGGGKLF